MHILNEDTFAACIKKSVVNPLPDDVRTEMNGFQQRTNASANPIGFALT